MRFYIKKKKKKKEGIRDLEKEGSNPTHDKVCQ
jgi:hypothetical protein